MERYLGVEYSIAASPERVSIGLSSLLLSVMFHYSLTGQE